jgi:hypothetical protein
MLADLPAVPPALNDLQDRAKGGAGGREKRQLGRTGEGRTVSGRPGELVPRALPLSGKGIRVWTQLADHVERCIAPGRELDPIRGLANKLPEHAARIAAVLAVTGNPQAVAVAHESLEAAIAIVEHHAGEALRMFHAGHVRPELRLAQKLLSWISCSWIEAAISLPDIYQLGPSEIRDQDTAKRAATVLEEHGWLRRVAGGATIKGNRRRDAWAIVKGQAMAPFPKFNPESVINNSDPPGTLAALATLAGAGGTGENRRTPDWRFRTRFDSSPHQSQLGDRETDAEPAKAAKAAKVGDSAHAHDPATPLADHVNVGESGNLPAEWSDGVCALVRMAPPLSHLMSDRRWRQLVDDALIAADAWGVQAAALGWSAADLFGVHPFALDARPDLLGLVPLLMGRRVVALTADTATIESKSGARLTYRRHQLGGGVVPLWDPG